MGHNIADEEAWNGDPDPDPDPDPDQDPDRVDMDIDRRPLCKYGAACTRKNQDHKLQFKHPK